jgi:hypothetical protein
LAALTANIGAVILADPAMVRFDIAVDTTRRVVELAGKAAAP